MSIRTPPVLAIDRLVLETAKAGASDQRLIAGCQMCRNRLLYLLNTAQVHSPAENQRAFRARIAAMQENHKLHANRLHSDITVPRIRWIREEG